MRQRAQKVKQIYSRNPIVKLVIALTALLPLLGGCISVERRLSTIVPSYASLPNGRDPRNPAQYSEIGKRFLAKGIIPTLEELHKRRLNILEISGGGAKGAFGAGVLIGWSESGTRPKFDVVTGISAGALLSTFAFLGDPEDDAVIADLFTGMKKGDVAPKMGGVLRFAFGDDSLMDNKPLIHKLRELITEKTIARVAAEAHKGRLLFVGLLNLDYRQLWVFDLTALAAGGGPQALETYRKILQAAVSPPLVFPPVEIHGSLFADGGTRDRLLAVGLQDADGLSSIPTSGDGAFFVIFNDKEDSERRAITPDIKGIAKSVVATMLSANMEEMLLRAYALAQTHRYPFKLMKIPDNIRFGSDAFDFDPDMMNALFEKGRTLGRSPGSWVTAPSAGQNASPWLIKMLSQLGGSVNEP
jgi:predicted acylesterase/phospholipase RssA